MRLRRKKPKSIEAFKQIAYRAIREMGWREVSDLTHDNITAWITKAAAENNWKGATVNHRMTAIHSLTERLYKRGLLPHDPLADAIRADEDDSSEGARAATLEEARALIWRAFVREQNDRRCKGNRTLYWACLFAMGCRLDEPARWKWKHVQLDMDPPRVCWSPDINKGKKRREQPIPNWLAEALRAHRLASVHHGAQSREKRVSSGGDPAFSAEKQHVHHGAKDWLNTPEEGNASQGLANPLASSIDPESPVFPVIPNKATFAADREQAGIPLEDYRGRKFTPHAARKFYSTFLTGAGVSEKMVDYLMRHQGGVEARYFDPPASKCAAAVGKIPNLLPDVTGGDRKSSVPNGRGGNDLRDADEKSFTKTIATPADGRYSVSGTGSSSPHTSESVSRSPLVSGPVPPCPQGVGAEHDSDSRGSQAGQRREVQPESIAGLKSALGLDNSAGTQLAVADFLESLARLLRKGVSDGHSATVSPDRQPGKRQN